LFLGSLNTEAIWSDASDVPSVCTVPDPAPPMVLVVNDLVTSGSTMRRSLEAIRTARVE
jgi:hypothetical protein